jgi:S-adenosylmethionine decarboxylase
MKKTLGTHIILDLHDCDFAWLDSKEDESIAKVFSDIIKRNGLTEVGKISYFFGPNSFTLIIALKESHLAVHTWPEHLYVSADIFTCNYSGDNTMKAHQISDEICKLFDSKKIKKQIIER